MILLKKNRSKFQQQKKIYNEKKHPFKRYKIQEVIKPNQVILVQVLKDERGMKGAALSTFISIAGKYIVLCQIHQREVGFLEKFLILLIEKKLDLFLTK